jgi:hypothetical protein
LTRCAGGDLFARRAGTRSLGARGGSSVGRIRLHGVDLHLPALAQRWRTALPAPPPTEVS